MSMTVLQRVKHLLPVGVSPANVVAFMRTLRVDEMDDAAEIVHCQFNFGFQLSRAIVDEFLETGLKGWE